jgi:hypothetical protein
MTFSLQQLFKLTALVTTLLMAACSNNSRSFSSAPSPQLPLETATISPSSVSSSPSPQTVPANAFQQGVDKAASAATLAHDAQTPEDWQLVILQWQQAISVLKSVPRTNPNYKSAQKLLPTYQQQLANAQQRKKSNFRQAPALVKGNSSEGGIPLLASNSGAIAVSEIKNLNQLQISYFSNRKRFANSLSELGNPASNAASDYTYATRGNSQQAISTAFAKTGGNANYIGAVYILKEGANDLPVSIVCTNQQDPTKPLGIPKLTGKEVKCSDGSSPI